MEPSAWTGVVMDGLPGEMLLVLAFLLWMVFGLILISNPRNPLNQWCFASGMLFSVGALKEFVFYTLGPKLVWRGLWTGAFSNTLYSVLSAVFYYLTMPTVVVFCLYFHRLDQTNRRLFWHLRPMVYLPALAMAIIFPCTRILSLQHETAFCLAVGIYNWCYGLAGTGILIHVLISERLSANFRQRSLAAVSLLVPLWFWMISAFPYHALGIPNLSKLWQLNLLVVLFVLFYYIYHAFRGGIWGIRFRRETYDWSSGNQVLQKNAQFVNHALKNDLAKIEWCTDFLAAQGASAREVEILRRSASHLKEFISRTQLYSQEITLAPEACDVGKILRELAEEHSGLPGTGAAVRVVCCDSEPLLCDGAHLEEALRNLLLNAADAAGERGEVTLSYCSLPKRRRAVITVSDNGCGMDSETAEHIFEPYYTTKNGEKNLGLGLYYCWNVMNAHGGSIRVSSEPGAGSTFTLLFPIKRPKRKKEAGNGADPHSGRGGRP